MLRVGLRPNRVGRIAILAAIAFVVASVFGALQAQQHKAEVTVFVARVLPGSTSGDVSASIADFITVVGLPVVRDPVSSQTGVSTSTLGGVSAERIQSSSAVTVSFTSGDQALASRVVEAAARQGLRTLAQQQVDGATEATNAARAANDVALQALSDFETSLGVVDLASDYQLRRQDLLNLQAQAASSPSPGLSALIAERSAEVDRFAAALPRYNQLTDRLNEARAAVAAASKSLTDADGKLSAADSPSALTSPHVVAVGWLLPTLRFGLIAFFVVFALGAGVELLEVRILDRRAQQTAALVGAYNVGPEFGGAPMQPGRRPGGS